MAKMSEGEWIAFFLFTIFLSLVAMTITGVFPWAKIGPGQKYWTIELYIITFAVLLLILYAAWFVFRRIYRAFK